MDKCEVACKPVNDTLRDMYDCIKNKVSFKLFTWIIGGLSLFVFGTQFTIINRLGKIETSVAVMASEIIEARKDIKQHEERIRDLELAR